jgi:hypothetical protein
MACGWRKVRRANIPQHARDAFERFGETIIANALTLAFQPADPELNQIVFNKGQWREHAISWLTERRDIAERKEQRVEFVEWAILVFVIFGVIADALLVLHESGVLGK